jgi:hypothetical protein
MIFDSNYLGPELLTGEDKDYAGSIYSEVKAKLFANRYYLTWGAKGETPLPVYGVTLRRALRGAFWGGYRWQFLQAANRTVESQADLRWGPDGRGFRRLLHPSGVCLFGIWQIDDTPDGVNYTGYFKKGSRALIVGRYSSATETRRGHYRSLALVGKLYPTEDPAHKTPLRTANFITQEDLGGAKDPTINKAVFRNAPDVTPWRRGFGLPVLIVTGYVLGRADTQTTNRQLYQIAELGKPEGEPTIAPEFMELSVPEEQRAIKENVFPERRRNRKAKAKDETDFRDEILAQIYDKGDREPKRTLTFAIKVSDHGKTRGFLRKRRTIESWKTIGKIVFSEAVASYNGDFVLHFHHPPWRDDRNDPNTVARRRESQEKR